MNEANGEDVSSQSDNNYKRDVDVSMTEGEVAVVED